jgi:hypothetical protein
MFQTRPMIEVHGLTALPGLVLEHVVADVQADALRGVVELAVDLEPEQRPGGGVGVVADRLGDLRAAQVA